MKTNRRKVTPCSFERIDRLAPLNALTALPASLGKVTHLLADTGYFSAENVKVCAQQGIEPLIAMKRDVHHLPLFERFVVEPVAPGSDDPIGQMAYRLKTQAGRVRYALRKHTVEPVFGIIKHVMGFRQFSLRGLDSVSDEWRLANLAWNIKSMHRLVVS